MENHTKNTNHISHPVLYLLIFTNIVLVAFVLFQFFQNKQNPVNSDTIASIDTERPVPTVTIQPTTGTTDEPENEKVFFFSIFVNGKYQIFVYQPGELNYTRLSNSPYEEIYPKLSPDHSKLAYSAKKNGYWDIYVYDLKSLTEVRITDSAAFDGEPFWSPDSKYLAFTSYQNENLDIFIQSIDEPDQSPLQITSDQSADFSPSWSPSGREIAFVSTQSGEEEIWVAKLNTLDDRFENISNRPDFSDRSPAWSADGNTIYWTTDQDGYASILSKNIDSDETLSRTDLQGILPSIKVQEILYLKSDANQTFLIDRDLLDYQLSNPPFEIPGTLLGFDWTSRSSDIIDFLRSIRNNSTLSEFTTTEEAVIEVSRSRQNIVPVEDVNTEYPYLNVSVLSRFYQLREETASLTGWDFLNSLDRAFLPITEPASPGGVEEWLFTGRAFEFNPLTVYSDLAAIIKEERNGNTYWRVFLKARYQDGSQGLPLSSMPWNLASRYSNDPLAYESGGFRDEIPKGYWIDFTAIARDIGWERLPALANWRSYFSAARFNQFVFTEGLDWYTAMRQVYPIEAIKTPTPLASLTSTPTVKPTIRYFRSPTASPTATETPIPTRRPTWTPIP